MKITNSVTYRIDFDKPFKDWEIIKEDSFEYEGPVGLCMGWGSAGGSGPGEGGFGGGGASDTGGFGGGDGGYSGDPANRPDPIGDIEKAMGLRERSTEGIKASGIFGKFLEGLGLGWKGQQKAAAALAVVTTALAPGMGVLAATNLAISNYKDRKNNLMSRGITADVAADRIAAENKEWGAKIDANVKEGINIGGGVGDSAPERMLQSLPGSDLPGGVTPDFSDSAAAQAFIDSISGGQAEFDRMKAINSKWTPTDWARQHFNSMQNQGKNPVWPGSTPTTPPTTVDVVDVPLPNLPEITPPNLPEITPPNLPEITPPGGSIIPSTTGTGPNQTGMFKPDSTGISPEVQALMDELAGIKKGGGGLLGSNPTDASNTFIDSISGGRAEFNRLRAANPAWKPEVWASEHFKSMQNQGKNPVWPGSPTPVPGADLLTQLASAIKASPRQDLLGELSKALQAQPIR